MEDLLRVAFVLVAAAALLLCYLGTLWTKGSGSADADPDPNNYNLSDRDQEPITGGSHKKRETKEPYHAKKKKFDKSLLFAIIIFTVLLLVACFIYIEYLDYIEKLVDNPEFFLEKPAILKYSGIMAHALLGLFAGFLGYGLFWFLKNNQHKDSPTPKLFVGVWVFLLVIVAVLGLFSVEAKMLIASVKRLETPAGAIEFSAISDRSEVSLYFDSRAPKITITDFQAGVQRLEAALGYAQTDFENIVKFCKTDPTDGPFCGPRLGKSDAEITREREKLLSAMAVTYGYANAITPITACLKAYACFYENGVPIQDDLSEIAASYATPPSKPLGCPERGPKDPVCDPVDRILAHLTAFKEQEWTPDAEKSCPYLAKCLNADNELPTAEGVISHRDAVLATGKLGNTSDINETLETGFTLPYRSMLSAALLTASGYPDEAVGHMERGYKRLMLKFGRSVGRGKETPPADFVESVLRLRLLYALQEAGDYANNQSLKLRYQGMERDLARSHMEFNLGVDGYQREKLLEECAAEGSGQEQAASRRARKEKHAQFVDWLEKFPKSKEINMAIMENLILNKNSNGADSGEKNSEIPNPQIDKIRIMIESFDSVRKTISMNNDFYKEWNEYRNKFILYFINADFLRLYTIAHQRELRINRDDLLDAQEWWAIVNKKPYLIDKCFSHLQDEYIDYLRFHMAYSYGFLHAQKAQRLSQTAELIRSGFTDTGSIPVDLYEVHGIACMGYTGLRRAYNIGRGLADSNPEWGNSIADEMRQTPSMLRQLAKYLASTDSDCLH